MAYTISKNQFTKLPRNIFVYWMTNNLFNIFSTFDFLGKFAKVCKGLDTCDNERFAKEWYEVNIFKINFNGENLKKKWFPYCKGGDFRKWYGNYSFIVNWENNGYEIKNFREANGKLKSRPQNIQYYFQKGLTFNSISSSNRAIRFMENAIFGGGGSGLFLDTIEDSNNLFIFLGLINSSVAKNILMFLNPTLNFLVGDLLNLPVNIKLMQDKPISFISKRNVNISKEDWDSFETSWDFKKHPLI